MTVAGDTHRCPPSEVLAAFVDARLPKKQVEALADHLASCAECRFIVESASEAQAEEQAEIVEPQGGRSWRWLAVAAVVGGGVFLTPFAQTTWQTHQREAAMRELVDAAALKVRVVEPRITGFAYGEAPPRYRGNGDSNTSDSQLIVEGKAGEVLIKTEKDHSFAAARDRGIAQLVSGHTAEAIKDLTRAASANDARFWSDLAAAYLVNQQNKEAIAAANRALALDPKLNEARFNKALATQYLVPAESIREWNDYLKHDPAGPWAEEAKQKIEDANQKIKDAQSPP